jgi:serine protease
MLVRTSLQTRPTIAVLCIVSVALGYMLGRTPPADMVASVIEAGRDPYLDLPERVWTDDLEHVVVRTASASSAIRRNATLTLGGPGTARHLTVSADDQPDQAWGHAVRSMITDSDVAVAEALRAVSSVVDVRVVAPGVISVAMSGDPRSLSAVPGVASVGPDVLLAPSSTGTTWPLDDSSDIDIDAPDAWRVSDGTGVIVAIVDGGFQLDHPDLAGSIWSNDGELCGNRVDDDGNGLVDDCAGWDFVDGDGDVSPATDASPSMRRHGTQMAGIIAARHDGVGVDGVAPGVRLMLLKAGNRNALPSSAVAAAIRYATDQGADVIDLSVSTAPGVARESLAALEEAISYAESGGVLVVAAAGNEGIDVTAAPVWPAGFAATYSGVISVGATGRDDARAPFSNWGAVDIWAPGTAIASTTPLGYELISGTSTSAALTAGAAALAIASGVPPEAVRSMLVRTGDTTAAGPRLNAARVVGAQPADTAVDVAFEGLGSVRAGRMSTVAFTVTTSGSTLVAPSIRMWLASAAADTNGGLSVWAVDGATAWIADAVGPIGTTISSGGGAFTSVVPGDPARLSDGGYRLTASMQLPAGDFALVVQLFDGEAPVDAAVVGAFGVRDTPPGVDPGEPVPPTTTPRAVGPTITVAPVVTDDETTTATPPLSLPTDAAAPNNGTTNNGTPNSEPTAPTGTGQPGTDGIYRLTGIQPGSGGVGGGTPVTLTGVFPTHVPLFVWFGTTVVETRSEDGVTAVAVAPATRGSRTVDVAVKFTTSRAYSLTLEQAFIFRGSTTSGFRSAARPAGSPDLGGGLTLTVPQPGSVLAQLTVDRFTMCRAVTCPGIRLTSP